MIDLSNYKAIIFDMDGTLVDSMGAHIDAWQLTCSAFNYPFDRAYQHSLGGVPTIETVQLMNAKYGKKHNPSEVAVYKKQAFERLDHIPNLIQDTLEVFNHYKTSMPIAVGTGSDKQHAQWVLGKHGLLSQLSALVTSDDVDNGKPHPETFVRAAELMGVDPQFCVVFEDTEMGRKAALAGGMSCFMVENNRLVY